MEIKKISRIENLKNFKIRIFLKCREFGKFKKLKKFGKCKFGKIEKFGVEIQEI